MNIRIIADPNQFDINSAKYFESETNKFCNDLLNEGYEIINIKYLMNKNSLSYVVIEYTLSEDKKRSNAFEQAGFFKKIH